MDILTLGMNIRNRLTNVVTSRHGVVPWTLVMDVCETRITVVSLMIVNTNRPRAMASLILLFVVQAIMPSVEKITMTFSMSRSTAASSSRVQPVNGRPY